MKNLYFPILVTFLLLSGCSEPGQSQYEKGMEAYDAGDFEAALPLFANAANEGYADAQYKLGFMYSGGEGTETDYEKAMHWNRLAAEQGHARAMHNIGVMYGNGEGVEKNLNEAAKWFKKAAELGQVESMIALGDVIRWRGGFFEVVNLKGYDSPAEALPWYEKAAATGNPMAIFRLGQAYEQGIDAYEYTFDEDGNPEINRDWETAVLEPDFDKAIALYTEAAEKGYAEAQSRLAGAYWNGEFGEPDYETALKWYGLAADQGELGALIRLGDLLFEGDSVEQDYAKALTYYLKVLDQQDGYSAIQTRVGLMYYNGWGTEIDTAKAIAHLEKGTKGSFEAGYALGMMYANGDQVPQDNIEAYKWYTLASRFEVDAKKMAFDELQRLRTIMSEEEIAEAEAMADAWLDKNDPFGKFFEDQ